MTDDTRRKPRETSMDYWQRQSASFPFHAEIDMGKAPNPVTVRVDRFGHFLSVPLREVSMVLWGFKTEEARDLFCQEHGAKRPSDFAVRGQ